MKIIVTITMNVILRLAKPFFKLVQMDLSLLALKEVWSAAVIILIELDVQMVTGLWAVSIKLKAWIEMHFTRIVKMKLIF